MATVVSIMDRDDWDANTDNIVVVDPERATLLWVPRDLWCECIKDRINRAFARGGHSQLVDALAEHGIAAGHSVCLRRQAAEHILERLRVTVPVLAPMAFEYPLSPTAPLEAGRKVVRFTPPEETLSGERLHQWLGARYVVEGARHGDFGRLYRQQIALACLLDHGGLDVPPSVRDSELVSVHDREAAVAELSAVDASWSFKTLTDVRRVSRGGALVLLRSRR